MRSTRRALVAAAAAAVALAVTACSSQGGARNQADAAQQQFVIAMVTHEAPGDSFWDKVRAGAEQAAEDLGVDLRYSANPDGGQQATLVQNAIDSQVDGLAVTLSFPDQVGPAAQRAAQAGIPSVGFNSGISDYREFGLSMYFGSDDTIAGNTVGERIAATDPGGKALCVLHEQGSIALEARCAGLAQTYSNTENLQVIGTDLPSVQQTLQAKLAQDPTITDVVTLAAPVAMVSIQATQAAGSQARIATFDLNADVAQRIQDGGIAFAVDQQPYVQGYMSVQALWLNLANGNDLGGGGPVLTGPSYVDGDNIDRIAGFAANNTR